MEGRAYLAVAQRLAHEKTEADWRSAAGRAYYALLLECRAALQRWGWLVPRRDQLHAFVRLRFVMPADADLKIIGRELEDLSFLRNQADYQPERPGRFADARAALRAVAKARDAIDLLDAVDKVAPRRAAAIAAIRAAFPP